MSIARAVKTCLALLPLLLAGAALAQDSGDELRRAATAGDVAKVKEFLDKGVDPNAANRYGGTALSFACDKGHTEVVKLLLDRGANPNSKDTFYNFTAIGWAVQKGHGEIVKLLLDKGVEPDLQVLMAGIHGGNQDIVKTVLGRGKFTADQLTNALVFAQQEAENPEMVKVLEAAGAKPPAPADFKVDPETLKTYVGSYEAPNQGGVPAVVELKDGKLVATLGGSAVMTLGALDNVTFRPEEFPAIKLIFEVQDGKVSGFALDQGGPQKMEFKKKEAVQ
jgi:Ankyrin repeats (3 copies)